MATKHTALVAVIACSPLALILGLVMVVAGAVDSTNSSTSSSSGTVCGLPALNVGDPIPGLGESLQAVQNTNAQTIYGVARVMNLDDSAAVDAITAALEASDLSTDPAGNSPDVIGLFGQSVSRGWGTQAQLQDPVYASNAFYGALITIKGWQSLSPDQAAADVEQIGASSDYTAYVESARDLVSTYNGDAAACAQDTGLPTGIPSGTTGLPAGFKLPANTPAEIVTAIDYALKQLGKPYQYGGVGDPSYDCSGLVMMSYQAAGVSIARTTYDQVNDGTPVYEQSQLKPGDLVFIMGSDPENGLPGHVGMYLGDGVLIQSPHTGTHIEVIPISDWSGQIVAMRDIVPWPAS